MSLKAGSRIRTYKPVVYKPAENAIVISDKNNDRKFMFLSEETQPDYRPMEVRNKDRNQKPCPRIDHRPLGADSYIKVCYHLLRYLYNKSPCLCVCVSARISPEPLDLWSRNFACVIYSSYERILRKKISENRKKKFRDFFFFFFSNFFRIFLKSFFTPNFWRQFFWRKKKFVKKFFFFSILRNFFP